MRETSSYAEAFRESTGGAGAAQPGWLRGLRARAFEHFETRGFPTTDEEDWKYTNLAPLARAHFRHVSGHEESVPGADFTLAKLAGFGYEEAQGSRLVFVNGVFRPDLSALEALNGGVVARNLGDALADDGHAAVLREHLSSAGAEGAGALAALNTAFLRDGAFVHIPEGVQVARPLHLLFLSDASGSPFVTFPRTLLVVGRDSAATVIESYEGVSDNLYWTNAVTEIAVGEGARLELYKVQLEGPRAFHTATTRAVLGVAGALNTTSITLGARLSRHDIDVALDHEGAECWVDGLYLLGEGQHHDTHSLIDHRVPRCASHQNYKGILDGRSRAVFNGRVFVRPGAQQTDAFQSNKNLLLSGEARVDTKPQLEIYADDVKCAHGATVGQLDEEELFYLVSRGLNQRLARNLLTYGFAEEIVEKIRVDSIKGQLDGAILNRLRADFEAR